MYFGWLFAEEVSVIEAEVTGPLVMMVSELVGLEVDEVQCRIQQKYSTHEFVGDMTMIIILIIMRVFCN